MASKFKVPQFYGVSVNKKILERLISDQFRKQLDIRSCIKRIGYNGNVMRHSVYV